MTETLPRNNAEVASEGTLPLPPPKHKSSLAPFNPTCNQAQATTLKMLDLTSDDVLFDLGCGDGRMLIHAAEMIPGLRCVGIELDPVFVGRGREALKSLPENVQTRVDIRRGNLLRLMDEISDQPAEEVNATTTTIHTTFATSNEEDGEDGEFDPEYVMGILGKDCRQLSLFQDATALYMFILPKGIKRIQGLLDALSSRRRQEKRPLRVVSYMFSVREWEPVMVDKTTKGDAPLYLYKFIPGETDKEDATGGAL